MSENIHFAVRFLQTGAGVAFQGRVEFGLVAVSVAGVMGHWRAVLAGNSVDTALVLICW